MSGVMLGISILLLGGMFALIFAIDRASRVQAATGKPSPLIRLSALVIGGAGLVACIWLNSLDLKLPWFLLPASLVLLGYGVFGWFATVQTRQKD